MRGPARLVSGSPRRNSAASAEGAGSEFQDQPTAPVTASTRPGRRPSSFSAIRVVSAFIGRVAASASIAPAGMRATGSAGTTTRSA